jgi:hypothetical protein
MLREKHQVNTVSHASGGGGKIRVALPRGLMMMLMIVISAVVGFLALMAYMLYLTPNPGDRL